ncbi:DUF1349 domain-containing protein [Rhodopirellula baltica]|uniref:DUF1349 domain-containing protein n=1 Tax=Rhodopirellula baltica SWK14 TaxID=993516 RepID=L7CCY6_RHOBT|nr:DUF1349 domain-containing protein [Rhodopirellula baltica]ELP32069.1 hypothetical protein RBSWK_04003 [Rhodopirellula baltica SWK14]
MMRNLTVAVLVALGLPIFADEPATTDPNLADWGVPINPAGDCSFTASNEDLRIFVPGSETAHDLSPELESSTAPRVVQSISGDFVIEVRIDSQFEPGDESTQAGRTGYVGAGLVVFADDKNFVRLERATLHRQAGDPRPYTNFEIRVDGQLERAGRVGELPADQAKPTWLRLERKGDLMLGSVSLDGNNWEHAEPKELQAEAWMEDGIVAGVAAISTSKEHFEPRYSEFSLRQANVPNDK